MQRSLGEAFSLLQKAARGAGMSWGMADECGRAAKWLLRNGLPLLPLAEILEARESLCAPDPDSFPPRGTESFSLGGMDSFPPRGTESFSLCGMESGKPLCPVSAGAFLCDEAAALPDAVRLRETAWPILLLPFLADAARRRESHGGKESNRGNGFAFLAEWDRARILISPEGARTDSDADASAVFTARTESVLIRFAAPSGAEDDDSAGRGFQHRPESSTPARDLAQRFGGGGSFRSGIQSPPGAAAVAAGVAEGVAERTVAEDDAVWNRLARLALRTLVPSDSESRRSGAGAGLTDND